MKAIELQKFLQSSSPDWQYPPDTVDTIKSGDPDIQVTGIAVGWMSYKWALKRAIEMGCNVFVTHEPTYYDHHDNDSEIIRMKAVQEKRKFIQDNGLVVIRCHDLWDRMEKIGIADAWGEYLGFDKSNAGDEYVRIYDIEPQTALHLAQHVASRTKDFGQSFVQLIGPQERLVSKVSIGTGAITPYLKLVRQFNIDLAICTDDGIRYWRDGAYAIDMEIPIIVVNHPVSEEFGVHKLAEFIQNKFPGTPVHYIQQDCMYRLVGQTDHSIMTKGEVGNHNSDHDLTLIGK